MGCYDFSFDTTLPKSRTDHDAVLTWKFVGNIVFGDTFWIDKADIDLIIIVGSGVREAFTNTLIGIL